MELIEESDRGAVIVAAALLEEILDDILNSIISKNDIPSKHVKNMFGLSGPLSSFSSKTLICYGFGFISKNAFDDLSKIRKLRNKFAHSTERVDFLSPEIEDSIATIDCCIRASKNFTGSIFKGRTNESVEEKNRPKDWEMRSKGFVKYSKSVFCLGVQLLQHDMLDYIVSKSKA